MNNPRLPNKSRRKYPMPDAIATISDSTTPALDPVMPIAARHKRSIEKDRRVRRGMCLNKWLNSCANLMRRPEIGPEYPLTTAKAIKRRMSQNKPPQCFC